MHPKLLLADDSVTIQRVIELTFADEDVRSWRLVTGNRPSTACRPIARTSSLPTSACPSATAMRSPPSSRAIRASRTFPCCFSPARSSRSTKREPAPSAVMACWSSRSSRRWSSAGSAICSPASVGRQLQRYPRHRRHRRAGGNAGGARGLLRPARRRACQQDGIRADSRSSRARAGNARTAANADVVPPIAETRRRHRMRTWTSQAGIRLRWMHQRPCRRPRSRCARGAGDSSCSASRRRRRWMWPRRVPPESQPQLHPREAQRAHQP